MTQISNILLICFLLLIRPSFLFLHVSPRYTRMLLGEYAIFLKKKSPHLRSSYFSLFCTIVVWYFFVEQCLQASGNDRSSSTLILGVSFYSPQQRVYAQYIYIYIYISTFIVYHLLSLFVFLPRNQSNKGTKYIRSSYSGVHSTRGGAGWCVVHLPHSPHTCRDSRAHITYTHILSAIATCTYSPSHAIFSLKRPWNCCLGNRQLTLYYSCIHYFPRLESIHHMDLF